jgi:hypothetical protein
MDQIVRHAGMLRLALGDHFQDRCTLELAGIGLVGRRGRRIERERVVDLRFVIIGITLRQRFHGLDVGLHAGAVIDLVVVGIHGAERIEIVALALGLGADDFRLGQRRGTFGKVLGRRRDVGIP